MLNGVFMAKIRSKTVVVCDAGPLIHLDEVGCLQLMADFKKVIVPYGVQREVNNHRRISFKEPDIAWSLVKAIFPLEQSINTICNLFSLDTGEMEALSLLNNEPDSIFLTDDAAARIVATRLGYQVHGTIGVLVRAIRRKLLQPEEVTDALQRIRDVSTLYIKDSLLQEVMSKIMQDHS